MSDGGASTVPVTAAPTVVFICAAGHSGSTLLDLLLGAHPLALSLGEITQLPKNLALNTRCGCGSPVRDCRFWGEVIAQLALEPEFREVRTSPYDLYLGLFEAGTVIDHRHQTRLHKLYRRLVYGAAFAHWRFGLAPSAVTAPLLLGARNKQKLYRAVADIAAKRLLIDSSKHYLEAVSLYSTAPERTKVLLLIRDGRAVFYSGRKRGRSRRTALGSWLHTYRRALPLLTRHVGAEALLTVRYEDLAARPAQELHRICGFVGLDYDASMLEFRSRPHHVLSGNDMRLASTAAISVDAAWRERLSPRDLAYFEARAGALNRELGYS